MKDEVLKARTYSVERITEVGLDTIKVDAHFCNITSHNGTLAAQLFEARGGELVLIRNVINAIDVREDVTAPGS